MTDKETIEKQKEEYKRIVNNSCQKLEILKKDSKIYIETISSKLKEEIKNTLEIKKENINELLKTKNYKEILSEINLEVLNGTKELNNKIESYMSKFNQESKTIIDDIRQIMEKFTKKQIKKKDFIDYCNKYFPYGSKDLTKELYNEIINSTQSSSNILLTKGPISYFQSLLSDYHYLSSIITMMLDKYLKRIDIIFSLLKSSFDSYINDEIQLYRNMDIF